MPRCARWKRWCLPVSPRCSNVSTSVGGHGQRGWRSGATRPRSISASSTASRPQAQRRSKWKMPSARRSPSIPGIEVSVGFDRPIYVAILGSDSDGLATDRARASLTRCARPFPGIADVELSVKPGLPTYAVRIRPGAVRELGLTAPQLASSLRAYVNGEVATYWTTPGGDQVEVAAAAAGGATREASTSCAACPWRSRKRRHADHAGQRRHHRTDRDQPRGHPAPEPAATRGHLRRRGRTGPSGDVGKPMCEKLIKATTLPPGYTFDVGGATRASSRRRSPPCSVRDGA